MSQPPLENMENVSIQNHLQVQHQNNIQRDEMNNEITSTSTDYNLHNGTPSTANLTKINTFYTNEGSTKVYNDKPSSTTNNVASRVIRTHPTQSTISEGEDCMKNGKYKYRHHCKSMGNLHEAYSDNENVTRVQNSISSIDLNLHRREIKKFDSLKIPIVGYEVMEERARFTIYKLKVEDDKRDKSWLVFRRYTDFVRLYSRIKMEQPNLALPLPGKRWFKNNFDPAFLEDRVSALQIFVNAILEKLPNHPTVREFFCLDEPPQVFTYQPEVQAVYGALEDSISTLKMQLKQKDATIAHLQKRLSFVEAQIKGCSNCSRSSNNTNCS